jgi:hypothetical protein
VAQRQRNCLSQGKSFYFVIVQFDFPAVFGDGLQGCICTQDIGENEAFLFVPNKCIITTQRAKESEIGIVFRNHDALFVATRHNDHNILIVYLIYERSKGSSSFFHPYFDSVRQTDLTYFWDQAYLDKLLPSEFKTLVMLEKSKLPEEYDTFRKLLAVYPQFFPDSETWFTFDMYKWAVSFVNQRCFGWGLGTVALVPLADMLNNKHPERTTFFFC